MLPFCNNLKKDDRVAHSQSKRQGTVDAQPRESSRNVSVIWDGNTAPIYVDVMDLRLVLDDKGTLDEHPPIDGEPPEKKTRAPETVLAPPNALAALKTERDGIAKQMREIEDRFKFLKTQKERLDGAIQFLEPTVA